jgi:hypothetical protein
MAHIYGDGWSKFMDDSLCATCNNLIYDEDEEAYICDEDMDEDDYAHFMLSERKRCPFYESNNEYEVVKHQAF